VKRPHFLPPLASFELAWTDAAFDAIYPEPPRSALPHGVASMHPARFFQGVLSAAGFEQSLGLRVTLWMIALAPLFTIRKLGTIASIDAEDRVRVLERLITSPYYFVRQLTMSFKAIATLLYSRSEAVRSAMTTPVRSLVSATRLAHRVDRGARLEASTQDVSEPGGSHEHAAE
jgi:hypothetical protein